MVAVWRSDHVRSHSRQQSWFTHGHGMGNHLWTGPKLRRLCNQPLRSTKPGEEESTYS